MNLIFSHLPTLGQEVLKAGMAFLAGTDSGCHDMFCSQLAARGRGMHARTHQGFIAG